MSLLLIFFIIIFPVGLGLGGVALAVWNGARINRLVPREVRMQRRAQAKLYSDSAQQRRKGGVLVLLLVGIVFLVFSLFMLAAVFSSFIYANQFRAGRCTIISKALVPEPVKIVTGSHQEYDSDTGRYDTVDDTTEVPGYRPTFAVTLHKEDSSAVQVHSPDVFSSAGADRREEQTILNRYEKGVTYSCWYYTFDPQQITFSKPSTSFKTGNLFFLIPFTLCYTLGIICLVIDLRSRFPGKTYSGKRG
jgi:hypothetical protein